jgi:hypothetical protein
MELCCRDIPVPNQEKERRGNDFSVKELCWCLLELEKTDLVSAADIARWKAAMAKVEPKLCYRMVAPKPAVRVDNWAAFNAASEQIRNYMGLADTKDYIENQVASQMFSFEENGMYRDPHEPMVYDLVTRLQLTNVLHFGYNGRDKAALEENLHKAAKRTLLMQSVTGELPFGGRSNQFLHNEAFVAAICEYEAAQCKAAGDLKAAGQYKAAAQLAVDCIRKWWRENPDHHIKNFYPIYSMEGCEKYAYYDKYMVTAASMLYNACLFCDDAIPLGACPAESTQSHTWQTSHWFHQLFCKGGDYFVQLDYAANPQYDASGVGRIQRRGAPSALCLAVPVSRKPKYQLSAPNPQGMSICPGVWNGQWQFALETDSTYTVLSHRAEEAFATADWEVVLPDGQKLTQHLTVGDGVTITTEGDGLVGLMLPAFAFDGKMETQICLDGSDLCIHYKGWVCRYRCDGCIVDTGAICANRNGRYRIYRAEKETALTVTVTLERDAQ